MAEPSTVKLPELPEPDIGYEAARDDRDLRYAHSADQMTAYGMACRFQALEEAAQIVDKAFLGFAEPWTYDADIAEAIRAAAAIRGERKGTPL